MLQDSTHALHDYCGRSCPDERTRPEPLTCRGLLENRRKFQTCRRAHVDARCVNPRDDYAQVLRSGSSRRCSLLGRRYRKGYFATLKSELVRGCSGGSMPHSFSTRHCREVHAFEVPQFPIYEVPAEVRPELTEHLGSKQKFWFRDNKGELWLFKYSRANTGEHWAEKLAAEIAGVLQLPHAVVELARFGEAWGVIVRDFTENGSKELVHGNELLTELDAEYPMEKRYRVRAHTLDAVFAVLGQPFIAPPNGAPIPADFGPFDVFVGYLMLDALVGNTDRHHENWGILLTSADPRRAELAPTYDHASSLGRELSEERRRRRDTRGGREPASQYFAKARSALFSTPEARRPMSPIEAFRGAAASAAPAGQFWLDQLRGRVVAMQELVDAVPGAAMEAGARAFCRELLSIGAQTLLD
jgi:hypothetical protein